MGNKRIYELPEEPFNGTIINNCFYVEFEDQLHGLNPLRRVRLDKIFEWIKEKAQKKGLEVKLIKDNKTEQIVCLRPVEKVD